MGGRAGGKPKLPRGYRALRGTSTKKDLIKDEETRIELPHDPGFPPPPPMILNDQGIALECWHQHAPMLHKAGVLKVGNAFAFASLCMQWQRFSTTFMATGMIDDKAYDRMWKAFSDFGMTPQGELRLRKPQSAAAEKEKRFGGFR